MIGNMRFFCFQMATIRYLTTSSINKLKYTPRENPGVYRRLKVISEDEPDIQKAGIDYDSIEDLEQDFMESDVMHDDIIDQMKRISKTQQLKITERRHFRSPKEPSMLSWSEKEQIRHLHHNDPENWTAEKLAESFPASPTIIKKILKCNWKPASAERLTSHDQKVSENWRAFHKGQLEVHDPRLKAHLAKFTDRKDGVKSISHQEALKITETIMPKPKRTEFLSIITSFKPDETKLQQRCIEENSPRINPKENTNELNILKALDVNYTLEQYSRRLEEEVNKMTESPQDVNIIINTRKQEVKDNLHRSDMYVAPSERFKPSAEVFQRSLKSPLELRDPDNHPNRIQIPKEVWKRGLLYKVNDCFYNDKGYFLYRVPGLKS